MITIFPSLIAADLLNLQKIISALNPHCTGYHIDVMDNHFVPNLTGGPTFIKAIAQATTHTLWVHLMVDTPLTFIEQIELPENSIISFHFESAGNKKKIIERIREKKWRASIAINPKTPIAEVVPLLDDPLNIDHVLIMSVEPGFSGQPFLPSVEHKIDYLAAYNATRAAHNNNKQITIGIDGGINQNNIARLAQKGVLHFAVASAIFDHENPVTALTELQKLI